MVQLKVLMFAMDGQGHVNALLGLAPVLTKAGHEVIFALSQGWESLITSKGYQFVPLHGGVNDYDKKKGNDGNNNGADGQETKSEEKDEAKVKTFLFIERMLQSFRKEPMEAMEDFETDSLQTYLEWTESMLEFDQPLEKAINEVKPDILVVDFIIRLPCILKGLTPWVSLWSCSPVALYKGYCPPEGTGFPSDSPKELWERWYSLYSIRFKSIRDKINVKLIEAGVEPYGERDSLYLLRSPYLNVYNYPEALDYTDVAPKPDKCFRMDTAIREPDDSEPFVLPGNLVDKPGKLIYFSLGSMGSVDLELMNRVIGILARSPHRFIISKGPYHEKISLPDNMWGDRYVNQIGILPHCDLVITHGGNNTVTESLYFGKPLIVMPLFYDQLDNAQRVVDKKLGLRLNTYKFTEDQLLDGIEQLLIDRDLYQRLETISNQIRNTNTREEAVKLIELVAITKKSSG